MTGFASDLAMVSEVGFRLLPAWPARPRRFLPALAERQAGDETASHVLAFFASRRPPPPASLAVVVHPPVSIHTLVPKC